MVRLHHAFAIWVSLGFLLLGYCLFSQDALSGLVSLIFRKHELEAEKQALTQKVYEHQKTIRLLRGDTPQSRQFIEKLAREDLHYIQGDEYVVLLNP